MSLAENTGKAAVLWLLGCNLNRLMRCPLAFPSVPMMLRERPSRAQGYPKASVLRLCSPTPTTGGL